jgi:RNA polymerase sigma factor for flagellar operon FliA
VTAPVPGEESSLVEHMGVAYKVAGEYATPGLANKWDDVLADAQLGLLQAIRRRDASRGEGAFLSLAFRRSRGSVVDGIRQRLYRPRDEKRRHRGKDYEPTSLNAILDAPNDDGRQNDLGWAPSTIEHGYVEVEAAAAVDSLLPLLRQRERYVIVAAYYGQRTLADIGAELGVTEARVSQIHTKALRKMREHIV